MKPLRLGALAAALLLAACTASPTDTAATTSRPSFDGGASTSSGNRDDGDGMGSGTTTTQSDTTGRGGNGIGSGN